MPRQIWPYSQDSAPRSDLRHDQAKCMKARSIHIAIAQTLPKIYQQIEEWR